MRQRSPVRMLEVVGRRSLSPNLLCLTFGGDNLKGFPEHSETASVKLLLPHADQNWQDYLQALSGSGNKPLKRTYSVQAYRAESNELDIFFALHPNPGPATVWALQANTGDSIAIAGPGRVHQIEPGADWFLLAGDMAAQAAICANIKLLPETARGYVVLETTDPCDQREIPVPAGVELLWISSQQTNPDSQTLTEAIRLLPWLPGTPAVWVAGESTTVRQIRACLVNEKQLHRDHRHTSGYWQSGHTEDTHHLIKRSEPRD